MSKRKIFLKLTALATNHIARFGCNIVSQSDLSQGSYLVLIQWLTTFAHVVPK